MKVLQASLKKISPALRKVLGESFYKNLRAYYLFNSLESPFPLYPDTKYNVDWQSVQKSEKKSAPPLVYIVSPTQRSGTNFLVNLLNKHEDLCWMSDTQFPSEACLYSYSSNLKEYCYKTVSCWGKWLENDDVLLQKHVKSMMASMGKGILEYVSSFIPEGKTALLKTPDAGQLENIFHLFPEAKVIVLNRDGRDTVESFSKSWGRRLAFKKMCSRWSKRVDELTDFKISADQSGFKSQYIELRYDDLNDNTPGELKKLLQFLELSQEKYPWEEADNVPILGSSEFKNDDKVHWTPIEKTDSFKPNKKWEKWDAWQKSTFKKYAGQSLVDLGFEKDLNW